MANPFKPDDKVRIKVKGAEVEATVRLVWNDEVQVRTPDKTLLWRTMKTVRPFETAEPLQTATPGPTEPLQAPPPAEPMQSTPVQNDSQMMPDGDAQKAPMAPQNETVETPMVSTESVVAAERSDTLPHASVAPAPEVSSCGVPETVAERSRAKRKGRRR